MKKIVFLLLLSAPFLSNAQFGNLLNKAKSKVQQRVDNKVDDAMDNSLDQVEGKGKPAAAPSAPAAKKGATTASAVEPESVTSYSKFDFVPGDKIIYTEDFAQEAIGELPIDWNTGGRAEVVTLNTVEGKWLRLYQNALFLSANKDTFGKNFTVEFDLILQLKPNGWLYPELHFGVLSSNDKPANDNAILKNYNQFAAVQSTIHMGEAGTTRTTVQSMLNDQTFFHSDDQSLSNLEKYYNKVAHISMQVQGKRFRIWYNGEKKFDIPMAVPTDYKFNQVFFKLSSSNYKDDVLGFYIRNIKVATGKPDARHKLMEEGKFSTTGILFDNNSAVIRPESAGVLKEIAAVLNENPAVKIKVVGHTSSDGDDAANLELSKQRAAAVKEYLAKEHNVDVSRLSTEGKGETKPVGDNKTKEGKAQNRRVEFLKL